MREGVRDSEKILPGSRNLILSWSSTTCSRISSKVPRQPAEDTAPRVFVQGDVRWASATSVDVSRPSWGITESRNPPPQGSGVPRFREDSQHLRISGFRTPPLEVDVRPASADFSRLSRPSWRSQIARRPPTSRKLEISPPHKGCFFELLRRLSQHLGISESRTPSSSAGGLRAAEETIAKPPKIGLRPRATDGDSNHAEAGLRRQSLHRPQGADADFPGKVTPPPFVFLATFQE